MNARSSTNAKAIITVDKNKYSQGAKRKKIMLIVDHIKDPEVHSEFALYEKNPETLFVKYHTKSMEEYLNILGSSRSRTMKKW